MDVAGDEVDACQQADRAVALILMLAREGRMHTGFGRQVWSGGCDGLDARFLVVGDDGHRVAWLLLRHGRGLLQDFHLAINAQHFSHLLRKVGIALFQVVPHFVRLHLLLVEDLAHRTLREVGEARVPLRRSMLAGVAGQKPRRPQFVGISKVFRLPAGQRHQPCLGLESDCRLSTGSRAIVERNQRAFGRGTLDTALNRLMMQPERLAHRKKRGVFLISQQYPRPLDPARRLSPRLRYRSQPRGIQISERQLNCTSPRCHDFHPVLLWAHATYLGIRKPQMNPPL